jgi:hypothetical protein
MSCSISQIMPTTRTEKKDDGAEGGCKDRWAASRKRKRGKTGMKERLTEWVQRELRGSAN